MIEDGSGAVQVEMQITCEGRTFNGAASGPAAPPERLKISAQATLQALDSCLRIFYQGVSNPTLVLDNLVEVSMRDFPVAVVMITASEKERPAPLVAACPLPAMSDVSIILATLQATTRTVSRWLAWGDTSPRSGEQNQPQQVPAGGHGAEGGLIQRVEKVLKSLKVVAAARVVVDEEKGNQVHIIATSETPLSDVSRDVRSVLHCGLGFDVTPEQISVIQSRLSQDELNNLLNGTDTESPTCGRRPEGRLPSPRPQAPVSHDEDLARLRLDDFQIRKKPDGGYAVGVRLGQAEISVPAFREGGETEVDMLELPATATLDAIENFLKRQRSVGRRASLKLLSTRRLRTDLHDIVVVLIAAVINGRNIPLAGAASADGGVAKASVLATLQATNAFVVSVLLPEQRIP